jgi:AcrR family transcriptional regulator
MRERARKAGRSRRDAAAAIREAAVDELVRTGAPALAMHEVAARASVSKGLIHYHYRDKDALLAAAAQRLGERIAEREDGALSRSTAATAVDDLRRWIAGEREAGEWRALLSLAQWDTGKVAAAARDALAERRVKAAATTTRLFALFGVRARIAPDQIGALLAAVMSGLAIAPPDDDGGGAAADVLALALLGLAE